MFFFLLKAWKDYTFLSHFLFFLSAVFLEQTSIKHLTTQCSPLRKNFFTLLKVTWPQFHPTTLVILSSLLLPRSNPSPLAWAVAGSTLVFALIPSDPFPHWRQSSFILGHVISLPKTFHWIFLACKTEANNPKMFSEALQNPFHTC